MTISEFRYPDIEERLLQDKKDWGVNLPRLDDYAYAGEKNQIADHLTLRKILQKEECQENQNLRKMKMAGLGYMKRLEELGFELKESSFLRRKGILTRGHLSRWDVLLVEKEGRQYVVKIVPKDNTQEIHSLRTEEFKTIVLRKFLLRNHADINISEKERKTLTALHCQAEESSTHLFLIYPKVHTIEMLFPRMVDISLTAYKRLHLLRDAEEMGLPQLNFDRLLGGAEEIFGGYLPTLEQYLSHGLISPKTLKDLVSILHENRDNFNSNLAVVHGDPKIGEHLLIDDSNICFIDLERLLLSNPLIDYSILSTRVLRIGYPGFERRIHSEMESELSKGLEVLYRAYRIYYTLTEVFNTAIKKYDHITSIDVIPLRKNVEFKVLLRRTYNDLVNIGINERSAYHTIKGILEAVNERCKDGR